MSLHFAGPVPFPTFHRLSYVQLYWYCLPPSLKICCIMEIMDLPDILVISPALDNRPFCSKNCFLGALHAPLPVALAHPSPHLRASLTADPDSGAVIPYRYKIIHLLVTASVCILRSHSLCPSQGLFVILA